MGAWFFMEPRLRALLAESDGLNREIPIRYVGRPERASPAVGSADRHAQEQARIVELAYAGLDEAVAAGAVSSNGAGKKTKTPASATRKEKA